MKKIVNVLVFLLPLQFLLSIGGVSAQVDPTKVLIGTWEGTVALNRDNERIIIIKSVKPKEDGSGWLAEGNFGQTRDKLGRMTYNVSLQGNDIIIDFVVAGSKNPGHLKLVGEKKLDGYMEYIGDAAKRLRRTMTLEKVESKKEEAK